MPWVFVLLLLTLLPTATFAYDPYAYPYPLPPACEAFVAQEACLGTCACAWCYNTSDCYTVHRHPRQKKKCDFFITTASTGQCFKKFQPLTVCLLFLCSLTYCCIGVSCFSVFVMLCKRYPRPPPPPPVDPLSGLSYIRAPALQRYGKRNSVLI